MIQEIADAVQSGIELTGVICEKPLGRTVSEAKKLVALAESSNLLTAYCVNQLFAPALTKALDQLKPQMQSMGNITLARTAAGFRIL